jgi:hypothetical protein
LPDWLCLPVRDYRTIGYARRTVRKGVDGDIRGCAAMEYRRKGDMKIEGK